MWCFQQVEYSCIVHVFSHLSPSYVFSNVLAWASVREPSQVFMLLETVYGAFDGIAKRTRVFKVESVGE